ncbi:copper chaperone CopZ [Bacillus shivajii]|uniref:copper chaperone CopZ n=1 Tax=Bacillus shivajii TaxID=1983719 RepID=UPI001CFC0AC9|nr:copper chaperone CopZ [Bacillus shivajii]UCZ53586.1 copper chaperone CopZ [Bacillus shivajii]
MSKETLKVEGMSCGHCVSSIEGSVGELNGVSSVKVNLDEGLVDVEFDTSKISLEKIKEEIDDQGFDVV